jgi:SAM-dependent methyltransferase
MRPRIDRSYATTRYRPERGRTWVWKAICEYLQRYVPPTGTLLDLGAGYCDFANQILAARRWALDSDPGHRADCAEGVEFLAAEVTTIPLPDGSIDVAFASNLLEHLAPPDLERMLREVARVVVPGGRLILLQPNWYYCYRRYWDDYTHVKAWSHESLPDWLTSRGWSVERVDSRFLPFSFRNRLPASYRLTRWYLALPWRPFAAQMLVVARRGG